MITSRALLLAAAALFLANAPTARAASPQAAPAPGATQEDARLTAWLDQEYDHYLDLSPMARTEAGDKKDYDKFDDTSEAGLAAKVAFRRNSVAQMKAKFDRAQLSDDAHRVRQRGSPR